MNIIKQSSLFCHAEMVLELGWREEKLKWRSKYLLVKLVTLIINIDVIIYPF